MCPRKLLFGKNFAPKKSKPIFYVCVICLANIPEFHRKDAHLHRVAKWVCGDCYQRYLVMMPSDQDRWEQKVLTTVRKIEEAGRAAKS